MTRFLNKHVAALAATLVLGVSAPSWASPFYAASYFSQLVAIDSTTGHGSVIGPFGQPWVFAEAFSPGGTLYIVTGTNFPSSDMPPGYTGPTYLATVNLTTGHATLGASLAEHYLHMLQFSPSGTLYTSEGSALYQLDIVTGNLTLIGSFGGGETYMMDLAMNSHGDLYGVASGLDPYSYFYQINTATGAATLLFNTSSSIGLGCIMGLAFDAADNLYGTQMCTPNSPFYRIDLASHTLSTVGMTGGSTPYLHGGDFAAPVPEPASLLLLGSGLVGLARWRKRRH